MSRPGKRASTPANQLAPTTCEALTSSSATSSVSPATTSIRNDISLCFQNVRGGACSTPQA